jgi:hypothetical protein
VKAFRLESQCRCNACQLRRIVIGTLILMALAEKFAGLTR